MSCQMVRWECSLQTRHCLQGVHHGQSDHLLGKMLLIIAKHHMFTSCRFERGQNHWKPYTWMVALSKVVLAETEAGDKGQLPSLTWGVSCGRSALFSCRLTMSSFGMEIVVGEGDFSCVLSAVAVEGCECSSAGAREGSGLGDLSCLLVALK